MEPGAQRLWPPTGHQLNNINQVVAINSPSPLFVGIHRLFQQNGTSISKVNPSNPRASILVSLQGQGLYAECSFNLQIVNDFVNFVALRPFSTAPPEPDCPSPNYAGKFEFDTLLTGKAGIPAIESLKAQVTAISHGNTVLSADLPQANRAGATMIFPLRDGLADGALTAGDSVPLRVIICLQQIKPFFLTVDVLGRIGGSGTTHNVSNVEELINAINEANDEFTHKGADTISMVPGTYTLSGPLPSITSEIILSGSGSIIERSSAAATQDFGISQVRTSGKLSLNNLTIRNGRATKGGGIFNIGTLTMRNTTVSDNRVTTLGQGGGIYNAGTLQIYDSTISGNVNEETRLVCFTGGCAGGGGIYNTGNLQVINSTVSGNTAPLGAGIFIYNGTLKMTNSTVSANNAFDNRGGGAILISEFATTTTMTNSVVAEQVFGANCGSSLGRPITSGGYNLDDDGSCHINAAGDKSNNKNLNLGPLQNNGGLTKTHALSSGSNAIDAGDPTGCKDTDGKLLTTDQRGFIRAVDGGSGSARCDMGAYEFNSTPP